ncbi:hypothetical protein LCGC14_1372500 [marine sediment metagenome]|uniref:Uncharacterized protein n=1 Tax=marine sediment metagenome TaxID=412755 RepID=A0A0F9KR02_9ZZZZ
MTTFFDEVSGLTINLPDDMSDFERAQTINNILTDPSFAVPLSETLPLPQPTGGRRDLPPPAGKPLRQEFITSRQEAIRAQAQFPLKTTEGGLIADLENAAARFDIARSNLVSEKIAKLEDKFPGIEIQTVDDPIGGKQILLRLPGETEGVLLDNDELLTFSDIAEVGGFLVSAETLGIILATIRSRGLNLFSRMGIEFVGGTLGRATDIGVEAALGFEQDPVDAIISDALTSGAIAAGAEVFFAPGRRGVRALTGRGAIDLTPEELAAEQTFRDVSGRGFTPGQIQPAFQRLENQAVMTSKLAETRRLEDLQFVLEDLRNLSKATGDLKGLSDENLQTAIKRITEDIWGLVNQQTTVSAERAGRALEAGRSIFVRLWKQHIGRKYDRAFAAGENASFDLTSAQEIADTARQGIVARGKPQTVPLIGANGKSLVDAAGRPLTISKSEVIQLRDLNSELTNAIDTLSKLDSEIAALPGSSAFAQIKELRTKFFDLKNARVFGVETIDNRIAGQIWDVLTRVMDSPVGGSANFNRLIRAASASNRTFERILEIVDIARVGRAHIDRPGGLIDALIVPGNARNLRILKRVLPEKEWNTFIVGYKTKLWSDPAKINGKLDRFLADPEALNTVLTASEQIEFRQLGTAFERLNQGPIIKALNTQTDRLMRVRTLIKQGDATELAQLIEAAGGKTSEIGISLRAGIPQHIADVATVVRKGKEVISPEIAIKEIQRLKKAGILDAVLLPDEVAAMQDREFMLSFFRFVEDPGAGIRAGAVTSSAAEIITIPVRPKAGFKSAISGFTGLARNALIGRIFMSERGRRLFAGLGGKQFDLTTLRALTVISAELVADLTRETVQ